ncbi:addiction module protein [Maribrevibacterium harenarium]|uniref:Addiction module protein n=1 Tax=Maribrevibacterium harenarium TaxID=2589817 RepID=A0A501X4J7_9GAMM|nr:addiction module protein [Maribrevibacterium harenarium]TPE55368.1 addiction module protein [Maribrevibacterium harenarium]
MSDALKIMLDNIDALSTKEKAVAAHCLLSSLDAENSTDIEGKWLQLAETRTKELQDNQVKGLTWEEMKKDITGQ